jgi:hypothetical protein
VYAFVLVSSLVMASHFVYLASGPNWPQGGEIDIIEGVHDNVHNQIAFHTENGEIHMRF